MLNKDFWYGKRVLVTGHTGFKGSWLSIWLHEMGAQVIGYALDPNTNKDNFVLSSIGERIVDIRGDIRDREKLEEVFKKYEPEIVMHLAAQPLVRLSYQIPRDTYEVNFMGTLNVLECIRACSATKVGIMITTDKCYQNKEQIWGYKENDALGGYDPYSASKACTEILISSYRDSFMNPNQYSEHGKSIASVRAGNVIGGGDWARDRIIPDCIKSLEENKSIRLRNPNAIRPWQHVLEPLSGYLLLAEKMYGDGRRFVGAWNFGPKLDSIISVSQMTNILIQEFGKGSILDILNDTALHESMSLVLDISKANFLLEWQPRWDIYKALNMTCDWYKKYKTDSVYDICKAQIEEYIEQI